MLLIEVGFSAIVVLISLMSIIKLAEVVMRHFYIKRLAKKLRETKQFVIYGWVDKLEGLNEMNIWFDPLIIQTNYPTLTDKDVNRLIKYFKEDELKDTLYIRGKNAVVIRIPEDCAITFGNGCFEFKDHPSTISESKQILNASVLNRWMVTDNAKLIETVRHVN